MISELLFIPIGMIVGTLSGFYGIGGGIVLMPILLLSGFSPAVAVPTSLMFTFGTSLSGALTHTRMKNVNWKVSAMIGSVGGILTQASNRIVMHISGSYDWLLNVWLIMILSYFAWSLYNKRNKKEKPPLIKNQYLASAIIGAIIGFLSALLGIGGGFVTVPLLISWLGFNTRKAIGTSLAGIIIISISGVVGYSTQIELNYFLGLSLIIGAFIGSPFGAKMTSRYQTSEMTQRLSVLYLFVISSIAVDLLAILTWPILEWVSLLILLTFLVYMLIDFYRHHSFEKIKNNET
ncbi:MAG: hypothetical protein APF84_16645 [Gracilibacter sp. BRH_c7a]|nr:MAG: hypothetical protein APF84_16645 [Gracilibacter sp. BRH_c7a]